MLQYLHLAVAIALVAQGPARPLGERIPLAEEPLQLLAPPGDVPFQPARRLVVKFIDGVRARATDAGALASAAGADFDAVAAVTRARGLRFSQLIRLPQSTLSALEQRAAERSGRAQPDLAGMLAVEFPRASDDELVAVGDELQRLPQVEFAYVELLGVIPPGDIPPPTPSFVGLQTYRGPDPGIDANFAWSLGLRGGGIRLSDCEYGWNGAHEDLNDLVIHPEPGQTPDPGVAANGWDEHGTAVLGETSAVVNGYACSGMVPDAAVYTFPEWTVQGGFRRVEAIASAIAGSSAGDVVLLEMQTIGAGGNYGPAELDLGVWTVCRTGADAGVIVVAAAGNGNQNLDSSPYAPYMARGDSGAIIVGAGSPDTQHDKLSFSTYGSRVNVQGWGFDVFSLGYGDEFTFGGDPDQTYTLFSGTSSASPFVASACVALEQYAVQQLGVPLAPTALRGVLVQTGVPQGSGGHIGPLPDLRAALDALCAGPALYCTGKLSSASCIPRLVLTGTPQFGAASGFVVTGIDILPNKQGLTFYSTGGAASIPFHNGTLCVQPPLVRVGPPQSSGQNGGGACAAGQLAFDYNTILTAANTPVGAHVWAQIWYRDPTIDGFGDGFTNAVAFTWCP